MRIKLLSLLIFIGLSLPTCPALSENGIKEGKFIKRWLVLGPIVVGKESWEAIDVDYLREGMGITESEASTLEDAPRAGDRFFISIKGEEYFNQMLKWKTLKSETGLIDIPRMLVEKGGEVNYAVAYFLIFVESVEETSLKVWMINDDAGKVWVNGKVVYKSIMSSSGEIDVHLQRGMNVIMVKIAQDFGEWKFGFLFKDGTDLKLFVDRDRRKIPLGEKISTVPRIAPFALPEELLDDQPGWERIDYTKGLVDNFVTSIYQDERGALWIGTANGISRYDGASFENFTVRDGLPDNRVISICEDNKGNLWVATGKGLTLYDGKRWKDIGKDVLAGVEIRDICQGRSGVMWVGTDRGLFLYDGESWIRFTKEDGLLDDRIHVVYKGEDGMIWVGTKEGLCRFNGKTWETLLSDGSKGYSVYSIYQDENDIFVGTFSGLLRYNGEGWRRIVPGRGTGIRAVYRDSKGRLWIAARMGDMLIQHDEGVWRSFTGNGYNCIYESREGILWVGTYTGLFYRSGEWENFDVGGYIYKDEDGSLWLSSRRNIKRYRDGRWELQITIPWALSIFFGSRIIGRDSEGDLWMRIWGRDRSGKLSAKLGRYDGRKWRFFSPWGAWENEEGGWCSPFLSDDGTVWVATQRGIYRYDGKRWRIFTEKDGLAGNYVYQVYQDRDGVVWAATENGLNRFIGERWEIVKEKNIPLTPVYDVRGTLWGFTKDGLVRYDGKGWKTFKKENELPDPGIYIYDVYNVHKGETDDILWIGTWQAGVVLFDGRCFQSLNEDDGLCSNDINSIVEDSEGNLWFSSGKGVSRFRRNITPPLLQIRRVVADKIYDASSPISVPEGQIVTIEYRGITLKPNPKLKYFYRLVGYDKDWRGPTDEERVEYPGLPEGRYTFQVQAVDRNLNYSEIKSVSVEVHGPPFYTTLWFLLTCTFGAFAIPTAVYGGLWVRRRKAKPFEPIPTPYIVGNPIRSSEMFFGREDDFRFIQAKLGTGKTGLVIVFAGERRSGKTSILFQILNGRLGEQFIPVLLDMQAMVVQDEEEFLERIAMAVEDEIGRLDAGCKIQDARYEIQEASNPFRAFEGFMEEVMETIEGRMLLLLFDEYELIEAKIEDGVLRPDIIIFFAGLLEAHPRLSFIFTGSRHLEQRNPRYWQILIGKSLYRKISFLSERDTLRLIREPVRGMVDYPRGIPERIYRLTAGQPFYTQVVCQNLVDRLNEEERRRVYQEDLEYVVMELSDNPLPQMLYFWDGLKGDERVVLSLLGEVLDDEIRYASARDLVEFSRENGLELNMELKELEGVLDGLFVREVLERERVGDGRYEYRFRVDLLRHWVRRAHSVWGRG